MKRESREKSYEKEETQESRKIKNWGKITPQQILWWWKASKIKLVKYMNDIWKEKHKNISGYLPTDWEKAEDSTNLWV